MQWLLRGRAMGKSGYVATESADLKSIRRVTWIGFWVNAVLMLLKIAIGIYGHSDALVADGVHSFSDFATDLIVIVFVGMAYKSADSGHPYGHGKFETLASLVIGVFLMAVAVGICVSGVRSAMLYVNGGVSLRPDAWTIAVALLSILSKESLYRYTVGVARKVDSSALKANAWHHRSDAISSVATLIGVSGAYFFGNQWGILDPLASILVGVFIFVSAIGICRPSVNELLDKALTPEFVEKAESVIAGVRGVKDFHRLRTRRNGRILIIDVHVKVSPGITVSEGHDIASAVEGALRDEFGSGIITNIHVEPYDCKNNN